MNEKSPRPGEAGTGAYQAWTESRCLHTKRMYSHF